MEQGEDSLYERLGGESAVNTLVGALYFNLLHDERVAHFFESVPIERVLAHQRRFLTGAFGGDGDYEGRSLSEAHRELVAEAGLNASHFEAMLDNLYTTLTDLQIAPELVGEVLAIARATESQVLGAAST